MQAHHDQLYREQMNPWLNNGGHRLMHTQRNLPLGRQVHQLIVEVRKFQDDTSFQLVAAPDAARGCGRTERGPAAKTSFVDPSRGSLFIVERADVDDR